MPLLGEIGTLDWTRRTRGLMSRSERARYLAATLAVQAKVTPRMLGLRRRGRGGAGHIADLASLQPPDSKVVRDTLEHCRELLPEFLYEHSMRSYIYARALGTQARLAHDAEILLVAAMYHDAGLTEPDTSGGGRCFTLRGADLAEQALAPVYPSRGRIGAEAITLHLNPEVPVERHGVEQHLLHDGVLCDVAGLRAWELGSALIRSTRERHPRHRFSQVAGEMLKAQGKAIPACRASAAFAAGFGLALRLGPWKD